MIDSNFKTVVSWICGFLLLASCGKGVPEKKEQPLTRTPEPATQEPVKTVAPLDPAEPNDDFNYANEIKPGDRISLAIYPAGDRDFYKLKITDAATVRFLANGYTGIVPEARLYVLDPKDPEKLQPVGDWQQLPASFPVKPGTEYFAALHDQDDDNISTQAFTLTVE
jgi:hypothetical protein